MPQASDSNYAAVTRHRRPFSTSGRPPVLEMMDDSWAGSKLDNDEIVLHHTPAVPLEDDEDGGDAAAAVTPNSSAAVTAASDRRRREEGWTDLGLDLLHPTGTVPVPLQQPASATSRPQQPANNNAGS
jgi:Apc13p protein